jgi:hypothetical protein
VARVIPDDKDDVDGVEGGEGDAPAGELGLDGGGDA